jgi:hypothetical protein
MGGPNHMFIENVIAMCDQIIRRAAEENPAAKSLQEIAAEVRNNDTASKMGNLGLTKKPDL